MRLRRLATVAFVAAAIAYAAWLAEWVLPTGLSRRDAYVSELGATGRPYAVFFRGGDLLAGVLFAVSAVVLAGLARRPAERVAWCCYAALGWVTVLDAMAPMRCARSVATACLAEEQHGGLLGAVDSVHEITSVLAYALLTAGTALLWWQWRRASRLVGLTGPPVLAVLAVTGLAAVVLLGAPYGNGVAQRIQLAVATGWLIGPASRIAGRSAGSADASPVAK